MRPLWRPSLAVLLLALTCVGARLSAQAASMPGVITGTARHAVAPSASATSDFTPTMAGLGRVRVSALVADSVRAETESDDDGAYRLALPAGEYLLLFRAVGYAPVRVPGVRVTDGARLMVDAVLVPQSVTLDRVVVSVARQPERLLDAAATVSVIDEVAIRARVATSPLDHVLSTPGVDVAVQGLQGRQVVGRGFSGTFGPSLLLLSDWRNAQLPSIRASLSYFLTPNDDDIERVEVVRGPASALYGSNAADGVVHVITRSPFDAPGTTISLTGGDRALFAGSARHAATIGDRFAVKVSGTWFRGREWLAPPQPSEVVARDPIAERVNAEVRADYRVTPTATATMTMGSTTALRTVEYTPIGSYQLDHARAHFAQLRVSDGAFFAQGYVNVAGSPIGSTLNLQTAQSAVDRSALGVLQMQHGRRVGNTRLIYGVDLQRTMPRTEGTVNGRNEDDDHVIESGVYGQASTRWTDRIQSFAAVRADRHSRLRGAVLSPRVGLLLTPRSGERLMLSYNRAFSSPTPGNLFLDVEAARLDPLPYTIRAIGVPRDGLRFARDCGGGLCMQSPFVPGQSLPLDGTLLWGAVVAALQGSGIDLSSLPAPQTADVATVLRALDTRSGTFATVGNAVSDVNALRPTITNSVEAAWTRLFGGRLVVDASAYAIWRKDFIAPLTIATPNVFLSTTSLASYLARFFPAEQAAQLAAGIGGVDGNTSAPGLPLGTVTPTGEFGGGDILLTYRNVGDVRFWGTDLALTYAAGEQLELRGSWSWVNNNFFGGTRAGEPDLSTNTPRQKALLSARYRVPAREGSVELRGRHVGGFRMADGVWNGHVPAFTVADLEAGLLLPGSPRARVTLTVQNLTNNRHSEFFAAPELGRLVLTRLQYRF